MLRCLLLACLLSSLACSDRTPPADVDGGGGGVDSGTRDSGTPGEDAGAAEDASPTDDAAVVDASSEDARVGDAGGDSDAGTRDGGAQDTGPADGGPDAISAGVTCDRSLIRCRRPEPLCPEGETASVEGTCYGPCVPIDECVCEGPEQCPHPDMYTCHRHRGRCGPFL